MNKTHNSLLHSSHYKRTDFFGSGKALFRRVDQDRQATVVAEQVWSAGDGDELFNLRLVRRDTHHRARQFTDFDVVARIPPPLDRILLDRASEGVDLSVPLPWNTDSEPARRR